MTFVGLALAAAVLALVAGEIFAWCPWVARQAVRRAARSLPREYRARYEQEWLAELEALPAKGVTSLIFAARILARASGTARALSDAPVRLPAAKRLLDLIVTLIMLVVIAPVMVAIAVAIRLDSEGPVFLRSRRVGRDGEVFDLLRYRFAEMPSGSGVGLDQQDLRLTRVGALLLLTSLQELPQLFNVLRGEMSLVGPMPLSHRMAGLDPSRLRVRPGMTGPWQIRGRQLARMDEMVPIDQQYVANWSLWQDVKLMLRTIGLLLRRRGGV